MQGICGITDFNGCNKPSLDGLYEMYHSGGIHMSFERPFDNSWLVVGVKSLLDDQKRTFTSSGYSIDGNTYVAFYGAIYNYSELSLMTESVGKKSTPDNNAKLIANLYEMRSTKCFEMIDGAFVMVVYDNLRHKVILARDRMGGKPLYYYTDQHCFVFGSELKDIYKFSKDIRRVSIPALSFYFQYTYIPAPFSIYENVYKLMAGHFILISDNGEIEDNCYWELKKNKDYCNLSYDEAKTELYRRLNESVKQRMCGNRDTGAFLSGGLDSGTIAALMAKNSQRPIKTYTIGKKTSSDESTRAAIMAKHIGSDHTCFVVDYQDGIDAAKDIISQMDEPFADSSSIPEYLVSKLASRSVEVALTGDAGDELLLGYNKYLVNYYADKYVSIPKFIRKKIIEPLFSRFPDKSYLTLKVGKVIKASDKDFFGRHNSMMQLGFKNDEVIRLCTENHYDDSLQGLVRNYYDECNGTFLDKVQYSDLHIVLEGDMLTKVDRMCSQNLLEVRAPLLANSIVEFAYSLPSEYKLQGKTTKRIMRDAFAELFPKGYDKFPKSGFGVPIGTWLRQEMKEELLDLLSQDRIIRQGLVNPIYVKTIIDEHMNGKTNRSSELWTLYVFEKWLDIVNEKY